MLLSTLALHSCVVFKVIHRLMSLLLWNICNGDSFEEVVYCPEDPNVGGSAVSLEGDLFHKAPARGGLHLSRYRHLPFAFSPEVGALLAPL